MRGVLAHLLPARVGDRDREARVRGREAVRGVVVGADDAFPLDGFAGSVDRAIRVEVTDPLARVVVARDRELVRVHARPARARHRVPAPGVDPQDVRAVGVLADEWQRDFEGGEAVRVRPQLGGFEARAAAANIDALEWRAGVVVERPREELVIRNLRHEDRVDDREGEVRPVPSGRAEVVVPLCQRALRDARERGRPKDDLVLAAADRFGPGPERGQRRLELLNRAGVVHHAPPLVGSQWPERELDRGHVRRLEIEDRFGCRRVHGGRAVSG